MLSIDFKDLEVSNSGNSSNVFNVDFKRLEVRVLVGNGEIVMRNLNPSPKFNEIYDISYLNKDNTTNLNIVDKLGAGIDIDLVINNAKVKSIEPEHFDNGRFWVNIKLK